VIIDGQESVISDGFAVVVPAGAEHNVVNTSKDKALKLYTIYMPPHHVDGTVHKTKAEAEADTTDHL
jgi:mannose-6-phosphate isomerase-like protein (cupin superfamily)